MYPGLAWLYAHRWITKIDWLDEQEASCNFSCLALRHSSSYLHNALASFEQRVMLHQSWPISKSQSNLARANHRFSKLTRAFNWIESLSYERISIRLAWNKTAPNVGEYSADCTFLSFHLPIRFVHRTVPDNTALCKTCSQPWRSSTRKVGRGVVQKRHLGCFVPFCNYTSSFWLCERQRCRQLVRIRWRGYEELILYRSSNMAICCVCCLPRACHSSESRH